MKRFRHVDMLFVMLHKGLRVAFRWAAAMSVSECGGKSLWAVSGSIPDLRGARGRRYPLRSVSVPTLAAMSTGANDLRAVLRWGRRLPDEALSVPGLSRAPRHATYRYFFKALDVAAAECALGLRAVGGDAPARVAVGGKRLRGSASGGHDGSEGIRLASAFASHPGAAIGQLRVRPEDSEATTALSLLNGLPLTGATVAGDAAFCRRVLCKAICDGGGACPFTVKVNRPRSMADIAESFRRHPRNLRRKPP